MAVEDVGEFTQEAKAVFELGRRRALGTVSSLLESYDKEAQDSGRVCAPAPEIIDRLGGAVRNPMRVPFTEDMTLLASINAAGGFNDFADQKHVRLLRGNSAKVFDVRQSRRDPSLDVRLQPGDRVEVPQSFF